MSIKVGQRYGRLEVVDIYSSGSRKWAKCVCECGKEKSIRTDRIVTGNTKSCGCLQKELASKLNFKHGESSTRLYKIYDSMKSRCTHKSRHNFHRYRGRGIKVCQEWETDYENFRDWALENGYADHLTLDRINNDGNYEPENCRWVSSEVQANNRSNNVRISWNGEERTMSEWAEELGMNYTTLQARIQVLGWSIEDAFTKEVGR